MKIQVLFLIILLIHLPLLTSAQAKQRNGIRLAYGIAHVSMKDSIIVAQPKHYLSAGLYFPFGKKRLSGRVEINYESKGYFDKGKNSTVNFEYFGPSVLLCYAHLQNKAQVMLGGSLMVMTNKVMPYDLYKYETPYGSLDIGLFAAYCYKVLSFQSSDLILESRIGYSPFVIYSNQARNVFASIGLQFGFF